MKMLLILVMVVVFSIVLIIVGVFGVWLIMYCVGVEDI